MQKIVTHLWFDNQAEEAANFYTSLFEDSKVTSVSHYESDGPHGQPVGSAMVVNFQLAGQDFIALNAGPQFTFNEAVSLYVNCETQDEVDELWDKLTADGGEAGPCGWLKDKYGLSWQIIPTALPELLGDPDPVKAQRAMEAMFTMTKIDIAALRAAHAG
jgi:predicted 3-demethylubiquinone-9 3-methyltransferase (glyoxalase superfamily)